jgi:DNA polymerase III subunit gamma/tau
MSTPDLFGNVENEAATDVAAADGTDETKTPATENRATQSLYRKFRPQTFDSDELVGQDAIIRTLKNAIQLDRVAHAYLFAGPRGTGKTTTARLLAKAVNCQHPDLATRPCNTCAACVAISAGSAMDVVEIDAASNRGIDDIRELRERVKFAPAQLRNKFYIIDEAHQITGAAANAFLKTLEEPPAHTRFVLATTDPEQILPTIVSRCQIFEFKRIPTASVKRRVSHVADQEGLSVSPEALDLIARQAGGSLRDALGLVDQLAAFRRSGDGADNSPISIDDVRELLGLSRDELIVQVVIAIAERDAATALGLVQQAVDRGADPRQIARQITQLLRAIMHALADPAANADDEVERLSRMFSLAEAMSEAQRFSELDFKVRHSAIPQLPLEIGIVGAVLRERHPAEPAAAAGEHLRGSQAAPPSPAVQAAEESSAPVEKSASSLADRVRSTSKPSHRQAATPSAAAGLQAPEPAPNDSQENPGVTMPSGSVTIDLIRSQWDQIRADVKARSRRIDALLVSVDPVAVQGDAVILASAYPFHRNKLSEPDVQEIVEEVIGRLTGSRVRVSTVMHDEAPRYKGGQTITPDLATGQTDAIKQPAGDAATSPSNGQLSADDRHVLEAAKNIFDAEEIDS